MDDFRKAPRARRHEVWRALFERQAPALERGMCRPFREGFARAGLDPARLPSHRALSRRLADLCGWRIETVPGLIPPADFFALLRERRFPSPEWIRHPHELEYTPAPDAFHDLFGHVPQLASPPFGAVLEHLAEAARGAAPERLREVERLYWFSIEFGLVREGEETRGMGAGLASSIAELERALHAPAVQRLPFDLAEVRAEDFTTDRPQARYRVAQDLAALAMALAPAAGHRAG